MNQSIIWNLRLRKVLWSNKFSESDASSKYLAHQLIRCFWRNPTWTSLWPTYRSINLKGSTSLRSKKNFQSLLKLLRQLTKETMKQVFQNKKSQYKIQIPSSRSTAWICLSIRRYLSFYHKCSKRGRKIVDGYHTSTKRNQLNKILIQVPWRFGIRWNGPVPEAIDKKRQAWLCEVLPTSFRLPRYSLTTTKLFGIKQLVIAEANEKVLSAVTYWRIRNNQNYELSFLEEKSRYVTLQRITVPPQELHAAVMEVRLPSEIPDSRHIKGNRVGMWLDSQVALHWIFSTNFDDNFRCIWGPAFLQGTYNKWPTEPVVEFSMDPNHFSDNAYIQTARETMRRPVSKLALLDIGVGEPSMSMVSDSGLKGVGKWKTFVWA